MYFALENATFNLHMYGEWNIDNRYYIVNSNAILLKGKLHKTFISLWFIYVPRLPAFCIYVNLKMENFLGWLGRGGGRAGGVTLDWSMQYDNSKVYSYMMIKFCPHWI